MTAVVGRGQAECLGRRWVGDSGFGPHGVLITVAAGPDGH